MNLFIENSWVGMNAWQVRDPAGLHLERHASV